MVKILCIRFKGLQENQKRSRREAKRQAGRSQPEMEWKLERTAPRRVRTEDEMLWPHESPRLAPIFKHYNCILPLWNNI